MMNKYEFITNLQRHLTGKISPEKLMEITQYYRDYIDTQVRKGNREEDVLDALGDSRLLAKTIVAAEGGSQQGSTVYESEPEQKQGIKKVWLYIRTILIVLAVLLSMGLVVAGFLGLLGLVFGIFFKVVVPVAICLILICLIVRLFRS